ncbi:MAG: TolC family protein [Bdellovibrionales bacterium]|nr:TolC family protein [Bdellovibrionales bacterium]
MMSRTALLRLSNVCLPAPLLVGCTWAFAVLVTVAVPDASAEETQRIGLLEAVRHTLQHNPNVKLSQFDVEASRGALQQESGSFDTVSAVSGEVSREYTILTSVEREQAGIDDYDTDGTTLSAGLSRYLRTGQTVSVEASVSRLADDISYPTTPNAGAVQFALLQPLLKGRGRDAAAANESQAEKQLAASRYDLQRSIAEQIAATVAAYWDYHASQRVLETLKQSEQRAERRLEDTKALVASGEIPQTDIEQSAADLAARAARRVKAEAAVFAARQALGIAIGIPNDSFSTLGETTNSFPTLETKDLPSKAQIASFLATCFSQRSDLHAAELRAEAAQIVLAATKNNELPQLDLTIGAGYSALDEGSPLGRLRTALSEDSSGPNLLASLTYSFPVENNTAQGLRVQAEALLAQRKILVEELQRQIRSDVATAFATIEGNFFSYQQSQAAVRAFERSLENETTKQRMGLSSILLVQQVEDQLTSAILDNIQAARDYAVAIISLRLASELLPVAEEPHYQLSLNDLITLPPTLAQQQ